MTEQALRECPFCGSKKTFARALIGDVDFVAACSKCNGSIVKGTKDQAIAAWNTRAYDAELEGLRNIKKHHEHLKLIIQNQIKGIRRHVKIIKSYTAWEEIKKHLDLIQAYEVLLEDFAPIAQTVEPVTTECGGSTPPGRK